METYMQSGIGLLLVGVFGWWLKRRLDIAKEKRNSLPPSKGGGGNGGKQVEK